MDVDRSFIDPSFVSDPIHTGSGETELRKLGTGCAEDTSLGVSGIWWHTPKSKGNHLVIDGRVVL
ncbi:hypothetical protein GCM10009691_18160 [Brevibacterium picturae]|uniref:Uncharacterized protein n=1 Tax=Brevibacterium picturae TaxID=260553 RepID=A0ABP4MGC2_9MICO